MPHAHCDAARVRRRRVARRVEPARQAERRPLAVPLGHVLDRRRDRRLVFVAMGAMPAIGWSFAERDRASSTSPTLVGLAWAYDRGDFSVSYPIARGGGALLAAIGGVVLLGDHLSGRSAPPGSPSSSPGCAARRSVRDHVQLAPALGVAATIGVYTLDRRRRRSAHRHQRLRDGGLHHDGGGDDGLGARSGSAAGDAASPCAHLADVSRSAAPPRRSPTRSCCGRRPLAPVGYVTALRESSVVLAALAGWRLPRRDARRTDASSPPASSLAGLVLLVGGG